MKAVALTIKALALLNNEERKKERSAKWHFGQFQFTSFRIILDSRKGCCKTWTLEWTGLDWTGPDILTAPDSYGQYIVAIIIVYACLYIIIIVYIL